VLVTHGWMFNCIWWNNHVTKCIFWRVFMLSFSDNFSQH
jgi:hypothetical protein